MRSVPLVLASGSRYRLRLLLDAGFRPRVLRPDVDERSLPEPSTPGEFPQHALTLARAKAASVPAPDLAVVLAADQLVVAADGILLHQPGTVERAVEQLCGMSGRAHELINGVVLRPGDGGPAVELTDRHVVRMRRFGAAEAAAYVEAFQPLDCAGSYRIEDDAVAGLIAEVESADPTGIEGLPMSLVVPALGRLGVTPGG